jgi:DNA ligase-1
MKEIGMTLSDYISALAATSSRLAKEALLKEAMESNTIGFNEIFKRSLDTYETFGVKKIPTSNNQNGLAEDYALQQVNAVMDKLADRTLTGNAAVEAIQAVADLVNADDWNNFYGPALKKDIKCGVNVTTWNKVAKLVNEDLVVPVFSCQLAKDGANEKSITGKKLVEVKLDGVRVVAIVHGDGRVDLHSRNGKRLTNFPKIEEALSQYYIPGIPFVLDGEVMSDSFQDLMKQVHRKDDVKTDDAVLYLFDTVGYKAFIEGRDDTPQFARSNILQNSFKTEGPIAVVQQIEIDFDTEEGQKQFSAINKKAIDEGYEGIMLKDPHAAYETKRSKSWLKIKPFIEVTLEVVDLEEGTGKYKGMLGALVCRGVDDGKEIKVNVGSGLSDWDRDQLWVFRKDVIGQLVEIKADAVSQNQDGTYSLRFPRFKTFRGFDVGEKL